MKGLILACLIGIPLLMSAAIHIEAIYPPEWGDKILVENGTMVTFTRTSESYATMKVYDNAIPSSPILLSTTTVAYNDPWDPRLYNSHVYIPDLWGRRLRRYSLLDPVHPVMNYQYSWNMAGGYRDMVFDANYCYMVTQSLGLRVINIAQENSATEIGHYEDGNPMFRVWKAGDRAAVLSYNLANETGALRLVNISNPATPMFASTVLIPNYDYYYDNISVSFYQNNMYVSMDYQSTEVYDVSNMSSPIYLGVLPGYSNPYEIFTDDYRYCEINRVFQVQVVLEPLLTTALGSFAVPSMNEHHYVLDLPYVYMINDSEYSTSPSLCLDIGDLGLADEIVYTYETPTTAGSRVASRLDLLYYPNSIAQLNQQGEITTVEPCSELSGVSDFDICNDLLYTTDSDVGITLYSLADPLHPESLSVISGTSYGTKVIDNYLFVRTYLSFQAYNISDPSAPELVFNSTDIYTTYAFADNYLWAVSCGTMNIFQVNEEGLFGIVGTLNLYQSPEIYNLVMTKHGDYLYVAGFGDSFKVYSVSDPINPIVVNQVQLPMPFDKVVYAPVVIQERYLLIYTSLSNQIVFYDIINPSEPMLLSAITFPFKVKYTACANNRIFMKNSKMIYGIQLPEPSGISDPVDTPYIRMSNYPNPFNPSTTISFSLPVTDNATIDIFNIKGQKVRQLMNMPLNQGKHQAVWDGADDKGETVSSGIYFYRLSIGRQSQTGKMLLAK